MPEQSYQEIQGTDLFADSPAKLNNTSRAIRGKHFGTTAPAVTAAWMDWYDTTANLWKVRSAANDAWITIGDLGVAGFGFLSKAGGTMAGAINAGGFALTNLGLGTGTAAARQQEVDLKAPLASPAFTTDATLNADPPTANSLTRRSWIDAQTVKLAGSTMTGLLTLSGDASTDLHAVPRRQLRDFVLFNTTAGHRHSGTDARKILGSDLDSTGQAVGNMLRANGSGATTWVNPTLTHRVSADPPVQIVSAALTSTWTNVDLTASVPAATYNAHLRVFLDDVGAGVTVRFRKNGSSQDVAAQSWGPFGAGDHWFWMEINLDAGHEFQWRAPVTGGTITVWLMGYDVTMF